MLIVCEVFQDGVEQLLGDLVDSQVEVLTTVVGLLLAEASARAAFEVLEAVGVRWCLFMEHLFD